MGGPQEASLPLSQESYLTLFRELNGIPLETIMNDALNIPMNGEGNCFLDGDISTSLPANNPTMDGDISTSLPVNNPFMEQSNHENICDPTGPVSCLSLPASNNWPGDFHFHVSFAPQTNTKGISWIYSQERNKLYIGKDVPCPVRFSTSTYMGDDVIIRAMALFSSSDHAADIVTRCVNHSMQDREKNLFEASHFIRCDSRNAVYEVNDITKRQSVIVPFENPAVGSDYTAYLFKFKCFGSCAGGPNRRPLMVVFTLESGNRVLGRQSIDLKVCACPARDYKIDEKQGGVKENKPPLKRQSIEFSRPEKKVKLEDNGNCFTILNPEFLAKLEKKKNLDIPGIPNTAEKKNKLEGDDGYFTIRTEDGDCYKFLKKMKRLYNIHKAMKKYPALFSPSSSSGE